MAARKDFVGDINPTKLAWSLVVGVARLYEFPSQWNKNEVFSLELVLQDEKGDRIHATVCKPGLELFKNRIKEHCVYSMQNFIVKLNNGKVRTTPHKYKLNFYTKTVVAALPIETFAFNPFKFRPFHELDENGPTDGNLLFDYIGEVVGKEEVRGLITRTGDETKLITLQLEDLDLATDFVPCSQRISQLEAQPQYSVRDEISAGIVPVRTIEEVLNITEETSCWIVGTIVSLEVGKDDWSYMSCKTCPKKVVQSKDRYWCDNCRRVGFKVMLRYRLQLIVTDGSGCLNLIVWNKEAEQMIGKAAEKVKELSKCDKGDSYPKYLENMIDKRFLFKLNITYKNINSVEGVYSVTKLSDDESLMSSYGVPNSSSDASMLPNIPIAETDEDSNGHAAVSLSKDSAVESNCDSSCQTPAKRTSSDAVDDSPATAALSPDVQASANKTFKRNCGRKKID
ncbi:hypothetical protein Ahy_A04g019107 [Arachis hypogaea]|uniref:Replication factor A C-terminal domain-containing protein n=1 Tax=Arachis hypogaea TaxID=3818 RepID=A0A445DFD0_ARAHY|nr:hypothetical protein Ahy_A04g019107 [Arachis hypogaea]